MELDRDLQRTLLQRMKEVYPSPYKVEGQRGEEANNLLYLEEHGLAKCMSGNYGGTIVVANATITAKGLDFLEDDGGLSAILGVVTVRLHADTIRDLIALRIEESEIEPEQKSAIKKHLENTPATVLQHLTNRLVDLGLKSGPGAVELIRTTLGG